MPQFLALLFLLLSTSAFALDKDSPYLISYSLYKTITQEELEDRMKKNKVPKSLVKVKYVVDVYDVTYKTCWHDSTCIKASGLYFVPRNVGKDLPQVVYHHGTSTKKGRDKNIGGEDYLCIGLAVDGYAVLKPDYIGLGHGERFHIYQNIESEGQASVDMLFAIRELDKELGLQKTNQLFLTGYSQGGHATLATNKVILDRYSKEFTVTASSANSGAYDMAGVQSEVMFKEYGHPFYLPYLITGLNEVYKLFPNDPSLIYKPPYDTIMAKLFDGTYTFGQINRMLPKVPKDMIRDSLVALFQNNTAEFPLKRILQENSFMNWKPENPVQLCYCNADEQVNYKNALVARDAMKRLGAKHVTARNAGRKYGHNKCAIFASMYSKLYFDSFRNGSKHGRRGNVNKRFMLALAKLVIKPGKS